MGYILKYYVSSILEHRNLSPAFRVMALPFLSKVKMVVILTFNHYGVHGALNTG